MEWKKMKKDNAMQFDHLKKTMNEKIREAK